MFIRLYVFLRNFKPFLMYLKTDLCIIAFCIYMLIYIYIYTSDIVKNKQGPQVSRPSSNWSPGRDGTI